MRDSTSTTKDTDTPGSPPEPTAGPPTCSTWISGAGWRCANKGKVEHDGIWYCGIHDPEAQNARRRKSRILDDERIAGLRAKWHEEKRNAALAGWARELYSNGWPMMDLELPGLAAILADDWKPT